MSPIVTIVVHDNNVEQALRVLKKKMQREGSFREMKLRRCHEKNSEKKGGQLAWKIKFLRKQKHFISWL